jgi:hypothetical protein
MISTERVFVRLGRESSGEHLFASMAASRLEASEVCIQYLNGKDISRSAPDDTNMPYCCEEKRLLIVSQPSAYRSRCPSVLLPVHKKYAAAPALVCKPVLSDCTAATELE